MRGFARTGALLAADFSTAPELWLMVVGAPGGAAWVPFQACGPAYQRGFFVPLASDIAKLPLLRKV
jgi:hypothetical protein